ncbi:TPA: hypothetical protein DEP58_03985 [Patescibacteria group bacterium]|nr:hypothetical protein [Patescibacteria group bacterium]
MGGGKWDTGIYSSAKASRRSSGIDDFDYTAKVRSGKVSKVNEVLDAKKMVNPDSSRYPFPLRESRDSDEHPLSVPVAMFFDVTGSMGHIPRVLQEKLPKLMDVIIDKAGLSDPQVLVGAIGDATCDRYPFQVGQFESDNSFDEQLRQIILEGGGGGQTFESYALAYHFAAYHTATDAYEKRGKKGYFFTMGDEAPWPTVTVEEMSAVFGISTGENETVESLLARAQEKWDMFHLFAVDGGYPHTKKIHDRWRALFGERFIMVEDSRLVCEVIAGIIHMMENSYDADRVVQDIGLSGKNASMVKNALVPLSTSSSLVVRAVAEGTALTNSGRRKRGVTRL